MNRKARKKWRDQLRITQRRRRVDRMATDAIERLTGAPAIAHRVKPPPNPKNGDQYYNVLERSLRVYDGESGQWISATTRPNARSMR